MLNDSNITRNDFLYTCSFVETNKHSFTIIIGTLLWSILWQFTRSYTGSNIILKSIYAGFYYIVVADLYTLFMASNVMYSNNTANNNFHDINYYNTLEMQPVKSFNATTNQLSKPSDNNGEDTVSEVSEDVPINNDETKVETTNKNEQLTEQ
jgi:hypothetical protein